MRGTSSLEEGVGGRRPELEGRGVRFRDLQRHEEYAACVELQRVVWGKDFPDPVPLTLLKVAQKVGGVLIGAFDAEDRLVGFVFGLTGVREGRPVHWSHMLAVAPEVRGLGIGRRLKELQRERLVELGVELASWTYDPLVARNAHLNLNRLGAEVTEYVPDMYGSLPAPEGAPGFGTDRFIVTWRIAEAAGAAAGEVGCGRKVAGGPEVDSPDVPVVNAECGPDSQPVPVDRDLPDAPVVRVEIPADIEALRIRAPALAAAWRLNTRRAFLRYLEGGYRVTGFRRDPGSGRAFYTLTAASEG